MDKETRRKEKKLCEKKKGKERKKRKKSIKFLIDTGAPNFESPF